MYTGYELVDPRDNLPFYVGITDDIYRRFREHVRCDSCNAAKNSRIQELRTEQEMMIMRPIFRAKTYHDASVQELEWIHKYQIQGIRLFNIAGMRDSDDVPLVQRAENSKPVGRKNNHEKVCRLVWFRHQHGRWPKDLSDDMRLWYEKRYFTKPIKSRDGSKYAEMVKSYKRGQQWIREYESMKPYPPYIKQGSV